MSAAYILLIDDNDGDSQLVTEALQDRQVFVFSVDSAVQGFSFLAKQNGFAHMPTPDLIVLDMRMPIMSGLQALKVLKDTPAWCGVPVVLMTGTVDPQEREIALKLGAEDVVEKPMSWVDLEDLAKELLSHLPRQLRPTRITSKE